MHHGIQELSEELGEELVEVLVEVLSLSASEDLAFSSRLSLWSSFPHATLPGFLGLT